MPRITTTVDCPIHNSFRVQQIAGLFDVPLAERARETFEVELPSLSENWTIGVIVGPSGSGKSTVARAAYGNAVYTSPQWPRDQAVIDSFPAHLSTKQITAILTAVGFSSPPSWIKPYHVLSNGERFRCDLALALMQESGVRDQESVIRNRMAQRLVVFDEFTSVVDRTVAKIGSAAVSNAIRRLSSLTPDSCPLTPSSLRFVAVTCHYDVVPWLEPDWVLDMAARELRWGRLRRPEIKLEVVGCPQALWTLFARHHYLSGDLARASSCYAALWHGEPVAFCATTGMFGLVGRKRITRIVVLPDYQGLGIGMRLVERVCEYESAKGFRMSITASHPSVINHCKRSTAWKAFNIKRAAPQSYQSAHGMQIKTAVGRSVVSFEFVGKPSRKAA